jgi:ABC-2 type transport system permease protein
MSSLFKLTLIDIKLYLRNFIMVFFTLAFPLLMLFLFGSMYGNKPTLFYGGHGAMDMTIPGYIATIIIGTTAFMSLPMDLAQQRQAGVLRRLRATPLRPAMVLGSKLITNLLMALIGTLLLVGVGLVAYQAQMPANGLLVLAGGVLSALSLYALGFAITSLVRTINAVRAVCFAVFYPMMFLSGGTIPLQLMPQTVQEMAKFMPMTYAVNLMKSLWFGQGWDLTAVLALAGFALAGGIVSLCFFRWE